MYYEETDKVYCYPNTDVLRNKFNIITNSELDIKERAFTGARLLQLERNMIKIDGRFDLKHLQDIHKYIFQDIYDWAGQLRKVEISKGISFARSEYILSESKRIFAELKNDEFLKSKDINKFCNRLAYYKAEINLLHPFREGNGRAMREFIRVLAKAYGYELDYSKIDKSEYMNAMVRSVIDTEPLKNALMKCITPIELINIKDIIINLYKKEFPAIKFISDKAANDIYLLNHNNGKTLTIKEMCNTYKKMGKGLEQGSDQYDMQEFNVLKDIINDLKKAKLSLEHNKAANVEKSVTLDIER